MRNSKTTKTTIRNVSDVQVHRLADYIIDTRLEPRALPPEFFYASLPLCVIDAVFSIGVTYTSTRNTVARFCERQEWKKSMVPDQHRMNGEHTIGTFLNLFDNLTPDQMADDLFGNRQRTSSRSGILKAEAAQQFAVTLKDAGINDFSDLGEECLAAAEALVHEIPGQKSGISFDYFRMLAGDDSRIKPDRMVLRFIAKALGTTPEQVGPGMAREVLQGTVEELIKRGHTWSPRRLDYVIWHRESSGG